MTHGSLFTGIGGFDLPAQWVGIETLWQIEKDEFCLKVLNKRFPNAKKYEAIKNVKTEELTAVDIISGGFPCQPFSLAGKRKGTTDDRYLWDEMFRIIRSVKPSWVIAENVHGLINISDGLVFEQVLSDMENEGYDTQPFIIPASAVNAPHKRDRVWIIANNHRKHSKEHFSGHQSQGESNEKPIRRSVYDWNRHWTQVASELCRMDDGISTRLDRHRIKALGNAIVPQVAYNIFKTITIIERAKL